MDSMATALVKTDCCPLLRSVARGACLAEKLVAQQPKKAKIISRLIVTRGELQAAQGWTAGFPG